MQEVSIVTYATSSSNMLNLRNFTTIRAYKGSIAQKNNATLVNNQLLLTGDISKSNLHVHQLCKSDEDLSSKITFPKRLNVLAAAPDGSFCVLATGSDLVVWNFASNKYYACCKRHFQPINIVRFNTEGSFFASGGEDGLVVVWNLSQTVQKSANTLSNPFSAYADHFLPITDIAFNKCIWKTYLCSISNDRSCRIYDMKGKTLVIKVVFHNIATVCTFGQTSSHLYLGDKSGMVMKLSLLNDKINTSENFDDFFEGLEKFPLTHKNEVTSVAILGSDMHLITGGKDKLLILWNTMGNALKILHQGSEITNILICFLSKAQIKEEQKSAQTIKGINKIKQSTNNKTMELEILTEGTTSFDYRKNKNDLTKTTNKRLNQLEAENNYLKMCNSKLFDFSKIIINNS